MFIQLYSNFKDIDKKITLVASIKVVDGIVKNALFIKNVSPNSKYLLETRPKYINQNSFSKFSIYRWRYSK